MSRRNIERDLRVFEVHYKGPIKAILDSTAELQQKKPENPEALYCAGRIKNYSIQILRASRMIADNTRLSNSLYPHRRQSIELVEFIREILRTAAPYAVKNGIPFDYMLPLYPIYTITEAEPLTAVLGHLLSNACRFHSPDGRISIHMRRKGKIVRIFVWDRGTKIPEEAASHIFEHYYTYSPSGAPFAGNGLGLSLAREFAAFLGGGLNFSSSGGGNIFALTLPVRFKKRAHVTQPPIPKAALKMIMSDALPVRGSGV